MNRDSDKKIEARGDRHPFVFAIEPEGEEAVHKEEVKPARNPSRERVHFLGQWAVLAPSAQGNNQQQDGEDDQARLRFYAEMVK